MKNGLVRLLLSVLFVSLAVLSATFTGCSYITGEAIKAQSAPPVITDVSPLQADALIRANQGNPKFIILDVRTPPEFISGHLKNAVNLDFYSATFREEAARLDKNSTYLVYCQTGVRGAAASKILLELGFSNINNMTGGITAWLAAGLPAMK